MRTRRRTFMQGAVALPAGIAAVMGGAAPAQAAKPKRDLLAELNVRPFINAAGTYTTHSGSLMRPEVMEAINYASQYFVEVDELHDAVGIASMTAQGTLPSSSTTSARGRQRPLRASFSRSTIAATAGL